MAISETPSLPSDHYQTLDPDVRLMLRVRDGSAEAFEELVVRYQTRLVTVLEHLVRSREHAEDLAQEVFLRVYRSRANYKPDAKFSTYLFTIANNVASTARRKLARSREVQPGDGSGAVPLEGLAKDSSGMMPSRQLDRSEMSDIVRRAIDSLNERQRMALLLSKFEHMSYADIATAMDLTQQAVKSLLTRARLNLRDLLEPYIKEGLPPL